MKKLIALIAVAGVLVGCAMVPESGQGAGYGTGPGVEPGRGTTGVSSGAEGGPAITGSDAVPR